MDKIVLVADIGGTNARFALAEIDSGQISITENQNFRAEDFETIRDAADAYCEAVQVQPKIACFAVAGPTNSEVISFTNSHWHFKPDEMTAALGLDKFKVVNDFFALAAGLPFLKEDAFLKVKEGQADPDAPTLVIGPGTGLGQALLVTHDEGTSIIPTEGGHVSFAPRTEEELAVLTFIAREHPRVSVERLLSGRGLVNIHRALCALNDTARISLQANEITEAARYQTHPIAIKAVDLFCSVLGRVAGDAVLSTGARGGVVLGGGILPKIQDIFLESQFNRCFLDKGRMQHYVEAVPIRMIVEEGAALYGAAASIHR